MQISILTRNLNKEFPIFLDVRDQSEEFTGILSNNVGTFLSLYNVHGFHIDQLFSVRNNLDDSVECDFAALNESELPVITGMPIGSERPRRRLNQEKKAIRFFREKKSFCVKTLLSPKRVLDPMKCIKWKIPVCIDLFNCGYGCAKWLLSEYIGLVKVIILNWKVNFKIDTGDISFIEDFKKIISDNNIKIVIDFIDPGTEINNKILLNTLEFIEKCLKF